MSFFSRYYPVLQNTVLSALPAGWDSLHSYTTQWTSEAMPPEVHLPLAACMAAGADAEQAIPMTASVLAMCMSLRIQDDIQDNDRPEALHLQNGVGVAFNFVQAYQLAAVQLAPHPGFNQAMWRVLQAREQAFQSFPATLDGYWQYMRSMTAEPFAWATYLGALAATSNHTVLQQCYDIGHHLGLAVQVLNDLDGTWSAEGPRDLFNGRITLPLIYALHQEHPAKADLERIVAEGSIAQHAPFIIRTLQAIHTQDYLIHSALQQRDAAYAAMVGLPGEEGVAALRAWFEEMMADLPQTTVS